jgi:hypothetical protein
MVTSFPSRSCQTGIRADGRSATDGLGGRVSIGFVRYLDARTATHAQFQQERRFPAMRLCGRGRRAVTKRSAAHRHDACEANWLRLFPSSSMARIA